MLANSVLYLAAFLAVLFGKTDLLSMIDHYLGGIAPILVALLALLSGGIVSIIQTKRFYSEIRTLYPIQRQLMRLESHRILGKNINF